MIVFSGSFFQPEAACTAFADHASGFKADTVQFGKIENVPEIMIPLNHIP
jgi:hypothetical protein